MHTWTVYDNPTDVPTGSCSHRWLDREADRKRVRSVYESGKLTNRKPPYGGLAVGASLPHVAGGDLSAKQREAYIEHMGRKPPTDRRHLDYQWDWPKAKRRGITIEQAAAVTVHADQLVIA